MQHGSHAGFCTFDERNAGGRYQTQAELRHFKHVLGHTKSMVDRGEKDEELQYGSPTKRRSELISTFARRMKTERDAHEHRIANMNRRITDYHNKEDDRLHASTVTTNFPAMHPNTQKISPGIAIRIRSPKPPNTLTMAKRMPCESPRSVPSTPWKAGGDDRLQYLNKNARDAYCDALLEYIRQQKGNAQAAAGCGLSARSGPEDSAEDEDTPATSPRPLPLGWEEKTDAKGRVFFIDHIHRLTTWTDPRVTAAAAAAQDASPRTTSLRSSPSPSSSLSRYDAHVLS